MAKDRTAVPDPQGNQEAPPPSRTGKNRKYDDYDTMLHSLKDLGGEANKVIARGHASLLGLDQPDLDPNTLYAIHQWMAKNPSASLPSWVKNAASDLAAKQKKEAGPGSGGYDPLAMQMFFFQTVAPYLDKIRQQTQQVTAPLWAQASADIGKLPPQYRNTLGPFIPALQAGEADLQSALAGSVAVAPSLDALMANVSAQRQAAQRDYYAQQAGAAGGGGGDLASIMQALGVKQGG